MKQNRLEALHTWLQQDKSGGRDVAALFYERLKEAEAVVIGAGSGLSAAAGLTYSGPRFEEYFHDFIVRYGMKDMYSAGFYPFSTGEEKWAYWSRHIYYNRYEPGPTQVYRSLYQLVKDKNYFVLTTNVDHQFWLSGFAPERVFATQGDYGLFQCAGACHKRLYDNEAQVRAMIKEQKELRIPTALLPKCPVCGGDMEVNLRCDDSFVEDEAFHQAAGRYETFLKNNRKKRLLFLELGVGMNTPGIIKYPFWQMVKEWENAVYVCINAGEAWVPDEIRDRSVCVNRDIGDIFIDRTVRSKLTPEQL